MEPTRISVMQTKLTKDGRNLILRRPDENDAESIIEYSKILFASTDQVLTTLEEYTITVEGEKMWINNFNHNPDGLVLVAELDREIVGLLFFNALPKRKVAHTGEFGVSVHPDHQSIGIGRALVEMLLQWAKDHPGIDKVFLLVFATNAKAIGLYDKLGFVQEGRHVKAVKQKSGEYVDVIQMYCETH